MGGSNFSFLCISPHNSQQMIRRFLVFLLVFGIAVSCSTDNSDDTNTDDVIGMEDNGTNDTMTDQLDLVGLWVLSEIRLDEGVDDFTLELLDVVVDDLFEQECYLISFEFKEDGTVDISNRASDVEVTGIEITCPETIEVVTTGWVLDGDQLTLIDEVEGSETVTIIIEDENTFLIEGEEGIDEEFVGSQAVFVRL